MSQKNFIYEDIVLASANGRATAKFNKKKRFKYEPSSFDPSDKSNWDYFGKKKRKQLRIKN